MKRSAFLFLFILMSVADLMAVSLDLRGLEILSKPLIVLFLIGYYVSSASRRSTIFILALIFCSLGDTVLLFESVGEAVMVYGLLTFLIAHGLFIFAFRRHCFAKPTSELANPQKMRIAFPVILAGTGLCVVLYPGLGGLKIPVMIYALVLTGMVVSAVFRLGLTNNKSFWLVFSGAALFMTSDSILAINKFLNPLAHAPLWIMVTYCVAQFLIVEGILQHPSQD